jgi:hypothetical protein
MGLSMRRRREFKVKKFSWRETEEESTQARCSRGPAGEAAAPIEFVGDR